jgi:hypothetical protein
MSLLVKNTPELCFSGQQSIPSCSLFDPKPLHLMYLFSGVFGVQMLLPS